MYHLLESVLFVLQFCWNSFVLVPFSNRFVNPPNSQLNQLFLVFTLVLAYLFPSCFCADLFHHITILPANAAMLLFVLFLFFATLSIFGLLALYGVYKEKIAKIYPFLFLLVVVLVSMLIGGIIGGVKSVSGGDAHAQVPEEVTHKEQQEEILAMLR